MSPEENRLYGMMQALMASRVGTEVEWEASPPRGIVTTVDAVEAVVQVAAVLDEAAQAGAIDRDRAAFAVAMLMVIRDHVSPLPRVTPDSREDPVGSDLQVLVTALRETYGWDDGGPQPS